jgi:hypothetical protein
VCVSMVKRRVAPTHRSHAGAELASGVELLELLLGLLQAVTHQLTLRHKTHTSRAVSQSVSGGFTLEGVRGTATHDIHKQSGQSVSQRRLHPKGECGRNNTRYTQAGRSVSQRRLYPGKV